MKHYTGILQVARISQVACVPYPMLQSIRQDLSVEDNYETLSDNCEETIPGFGGLSDFQYYAWITPWPQTSTNSQPA